MSGRVIKSALVVGTAASFAVLGGSADLAGASRGPILRAKAPKLMLAGNIRPASAVAPGDRIERTIVLRLRGRARRSTVALTVKTKRASLLTDHRQGGLILSLDRCSRRWKRTPEEHSYTCRGRRTRLITHRRLLGGRKARLTLRRGARAHLRLTLTLPAEVGDALQNQTSTLVYRFTSVAQGYPGTVHKECPNPVRLSCIAPSLRGRFR